MRIFVSAPMRERRWLWIVALVLSLALATSGCSQIKSWWNPDDDSTDLDDAANANEGEPLPPPVANVAINYRHPGDALARATVIKFFGAEVIKNDQRDASHTESVVRFDGGVPIWEFKADEGTFGSLTGVGASKYSLKNIEYAKVPAHFAQILPEEGPPEPLDRGATTSFRSSACRDRSATRRSRCWPTDRSRPTMRNRERAAAICSAATLRRTFLSRLFFPIRLRTPEPRIHHPTKIPTKAVLHQRRCLPSIPTLAVRRSLFIALFLPLIA